MRASSSSSNSSCRSPTKRLEEVLDREQAGHPAVLVDHDGDGPAVLAHVGQRLEHPERLGEEVGLAHLARDLQRARVGRVAVRSVVRRLVHAISGVPRVPASSGAEDVVDEEDADEVVEVVVHDREAAVPRGAHGLRDVLGVDRDGQVGDVDPRRHDLAHVHVAQVGQRLGDDALLLGRLRLEGLARRRRLARSRRRRRRRGARAGATASACVVVRVRRVPACDTARRRQVMRSGPACELGSGAHQHRHGRERVVGVGAVVEEGGHGPAEPQRVERLDQPALGARAPGQEDVGPAVEQHQHRDVVERVVGLLEAQLQA